jgi:hypothetical protein
MAPYKWPFDLIGITSAGRVGVASTADASSDEKAATSSPVASSSNEMVTFSGCRAALTLTATTSNSCSTFCRCEPHRQARLG